MNREEALAAAENPDWSTRVAGGKALVDYSDDEAAAALGYLLMDPENTSPVVETAKALVARNDLFAAKLLFSAVAVAPAECNDHLVWIISSAEHEGFDLDRLMTDLKADSHPWVREGLRQYLDWNTTRPR